MERPLLSMTRGDTFDFTVKLMNGETGEPFLPEEGAEVHFTVKTDVYSEKVAIHKVQTNFDNHVVSFRINPEDTLNLTFNEYYFDVEYRCNGCVKTVVKCAKLEISKEVTTYREE